MKKNLNYTISVWQKSTQLVDGEPSKKLLCMFFEVKNLEAALNLCRGALQIALTQVSSECFCTILDGDRKVGSYFYNSFTAEYKFKSAVTVSDITGAASYRLSKKHY